MFKDTPDGQTHFQNDGCGMKEHNQICSVCKKPATETMGTCLCLPSHGEWHLGCDPHNRDDELSVESLIKSRIPPNLQEVVRVIVRMEVERVRK